jgi:hypothetical protein
VIRLGELEGLLARTNFLRNAVQFVIEDIAEALREDERKDVVLVFRRVLGPADGAGGIPDPGFEGFLFFGSGHGAGNLHQTPCGWHERRLS